MAAAQNPIVRDDRPAYSITERTSLPRLSVPKGCCHDGGCSDGEPMSAGPLEEKNGANTDNDVIATRTTIPMPPKRVRNRRCNRTSGAEARNRPDACAIDISTLGSAGIDVLPAGELALN